jgi:hypothetical protein
MSRYKKVVSVNNPRIEHSFGEIGHNEHFPTNELQLLANRMNQARGPHSPTTPDPPSS